MVMRELRDGLGGKMPASVGSSPMLLGASPPPNGGYDLAICTKELLIRVTGSTR